MRLFSILGVGGECIVGTKKTQFTLCQTKSCSVVHYSQAMGFPMSEASSDMSK